MSLQEKWRHLDTKRADGIYITWYREELEDSDASPRDYLFQDPDYQEEDQARLEAWQAGDWHMVGIRARAEILIVRNGMGTTHTLTSAGLWGVESDSGEEYLSTVFEEEKAALLEDMRAMGVLPVHDVAAYRA